jgi:hypothetical protein
VHEPGVTNGPAGRVDHEQDYVEFWPAGIAASGRFVCTACGNGVNVRQVLPRCMLCGERLWERAELSQVTASPAF